MTLLAPLAGLLAGAIGLGVLIALHALKLRRRELRISSTLLWSNAARDLEVNTPWRAPRPTLLLFLQALGILLLALAIARPVLGSADRVPARIIVVLDASASMNARDADGPTRFEQAQRSATDRVTALRRGSANPEIGVVVASGNPRMALAPTRSIESALAAIRDAQPTDQPLNTDALRDLLGALRDQDGGEDADTARPDPTLWVFTDAGELAPVDFPAWSGEILAVAGPAADNTGITALHAARDPASPDTARVFVGVTSNAARPVGVVLRLRSGEVTATVPMEIPAATESGPGTANRTVALRVPGAGRIEAALDQGGSLPTDDRAWADLPDPRPPRTVVYAEGRDADPFLMDVLGVLAPGGVSVHEPTDLEALRGAELVVYDRVTPRALPGVASLGFGSAWPGSPVDLRDGRERVVAWDRAHPVLRDLTLAPVVYDRAVSLPDTDTPGVTVLAESARGPVITETVGAGVRHLRVAFPLSRSNWAVDVGMPIFIAAAFEHLAPGTRGEAVVRTTGGAITLASRGGDERVTASGPAEASAPAGPDGTATLPALTRVGEYQVTGADEDSLAVSLLDAGETAAAVGPSAAFGSSTPGTVGAQAGDGLAGRLELWPWVLMAAVVVMTAEWLVHVARARV